MSTFEDIWYAARSTRIVYMPPKLLETFGESCVHYLVVSEDMDRPGKLYLRSGIVTAERPRIVTPAYFRQHAVDNFNEDAKKYFDEVLAREVNARFMEYGLHFGKKEFLMETVSGNPQEVAEQAAADAQDDLEKLQGVIIGPDDAWEVSLMHFITQLVQRSIPFHARDIAQRGLFELDNGVPRAVLQEIERDFLACDNLKGARNLGAKLRDFGLFEKFEDRFYELYKHFK